MIISRYERFVCSNIFFLYVTGIGSYLMFSNSLTISQIYFTKHRPFASGIVAFGVSIGIIIGPLITQALLDRYGLRGCMLLLGGINLHGLIYAGLIRPPLGNRKKKKKNIITNNTQSSPNNNISSSKSCSSSSIITFIPFMTFLVGLTMTLMGEFFNYMYIPLRAESMNIPVHKRAWLVSMLGISGAVAKPVIGWTGNSTCMANRQSIIFGISSFFAGVLIFVSYTFHDFLSMAIFCSLDGWFMGKYTLFCFK